MFIKLTYKQEMTINILHRTVWPIIFTIKCYKNNYTHAHINKNILFDK